MRLKSFEVEGFRNIGRRLRLENLQRINLIHGENNVGKSNLLHAIRLLFALPRLSEGLEEGESQLLTNDDFVGLGFKRGARDIFGLDTPDRPIFLGGVVRLEGEDLKRAPLNGVGEVEGLDFYIGYELTPRGPETLCKWIEANLEMNLYSDKKKLKELRAWIGGEPGRPSFDWLDTLRLRESSASHLASVYFDFRDSDLVDEQQIYKRFGQEMVRHFGGLIGEGEIKFLREKVEVASGSEPIRIQVEERKHFSFAPPGKNPIPFHLLGTGVQQLFMFMGHLLASKAAIVGIEEPEMNLRYTNQRKLGEILRDMVGKPGAPSQIFMTSHSPALEQGEHFYLMEKGADGPMVRIRPIKEARRATGMADDERLPPAGEADSCYVSTEGVTIVPKDVMQIIGIPDGGGVMYLEMDPEMCSKVQSNIMRVLSDEDFVKEFGISDDGEPGEGFRLQTTKRSLARIYNVNVVYFEERHAEHTASFLAQRYETNEDWQAAKRRLCALQLNLVDAELYAARKKVKCSATLDWLLIGQADCEQWIVVTDEQKSEWSLFSSKISLKEVNDLLKSLLN